jgi:hypothetical protein
MDAWAALTAEQKLTILAALHDAKWGHVITGCGDCDAAQLADGEGGECKRHAGEMDRAEKYDALMLALGGQN